MGALRNQAGQSPASAARQSDAQRRVAGDRRSETTMLSMARQMFRSIRHGQRANDATASPSAPTPLDLSDPAQRKLGNYELLELIGQGGMGVVYRARQPALDREVAVKLLAAGAWATPEFVARFRHEARNAARMQHSNIVTIHEIECSDELQYYSMRLVNGPSLAQVLRQEGHLDLDRAISLMRRIAAALEHAHRSGLLHLDLKPGNILLDESGQPHVTDFGLSRRQFERPPECEGLSGTPSYMAPEQTDTSLGAISAATDIWGLGAVLYEMLTGQPPFLAGSAQATLELVQHGTVRTPRRYGPALPRDIEAIVMKCLAHDPAARYASVGAFADDLERFQQMREVEARPLRWPGRLWRAVQREPRIAVMAMLVLIAGLLALFAIWPGWHASLHIPKH